MLELTFYISHSHVYKVPLSDYTNNTRM